MLNIWFHFCIFREIVHFLFYLGIFWIHWDTKVYVWKSLGYFIHIRHQLHWKAKKTTMSGTCLVRKKQLFITLCLSISLCLSLHLCLCPLLKQKRNKAIQGKHFLLCSYEYCLRISFFFCTRIGLGKDHDKI